MNIVFRGEMLTLHHSGLLYWPRRKIAVVSDLHLEKGSHFGLRGFFLPPYDSRETLHRLLKALKEIGPEKIILLGDCFHDAKGFSRLGKAEHAMFATLMEFSCTWIEGNHDAGFVPDGVTCHAEWRENGLVFRHAPQDLEEKDGEISGHYHPKVEITHKGGRISRACFIEDGNRMIMPSFGAYTGGLNIKDKAISRFFAGPYRCHTVGSSKVYSFAFEQE